MEIDKGKAQSHRWWKTTLRQKRPEEVARLQQQIDADQKRLYAVCRERKDTDGAELVDCIRRLIENSMAFAHYAGIRRGYKIGVQVGQTEDQPRIGALIMKNPDASTAQICTMLDEKAVPMQWSELRNSGRWPDFATMPKVKNYITRMRKIAHKIQRVQTWRQIMREHERNRS